MTELPPPEPMEAVLGALHDLPIQDWLRVRLGREPFPLYGILREEGFSWRGHWTAEGFDLLIWHEGAEPFDAGKADSW